MKRKKKIKNLKGVKKMEKKMKKDVSDVVSLRIVLAQIQTLHKNILEEKDTAIKMEQQAKFDFKRQIIACKALLKETVKRIHKRTRSTDTPSKIKSFSLFIEKGKVVGEIIFGFYPCHSEYLLERSRRSFVKEVSTLLKIPETWIDLSFGHTEEMK